VDILLALWNVGSIAVFIVMKTRTNNEKLKCGQGSNEGLK